MHAGANSVLLFCKTHGISRATFYNLMKRGEGPIVMRVGRRTLVSDEAAAAWRRRMETLAAAQPVQEAFSADRTLPGPALPTLKRAGKARIAEAANVA